MEAHDTTTVETKTHGDRDNLYDVLLQASCSGCSRPPNQY